MALAVQAQDAKRPVLSSHDRIEGPFGGENHVEDLQVFEDGRVTYVEDETKTMGAKPEHSAYEATISPAEMQRLARLLGAREIRSLPEKVSSKTRPIDFFWQKSLEINRPDKTQKILIENFYPFLNAHEPAYPKALIELECSLQDIKLEVAKRLHPKDEDDWCREIRASAEPAQGDCREDASQPRIVAGEGWGPVRLGAPAQAVDAFLGDGHPANKYSDVRFKDYPQKGVQVSFENGNNTVHAIFFYNGQRHSEEEGTFCGQTSNGIGWQSSVEEVKKVYGHPIAEFSGNDSGGTWQRLVFTGIDFRFENGKMVRIGIPGQ